MSNDHSSDHITPASSLAKLTKARKVIAKLEGQQLKLNEAREKAARELEDAERHEAIETGRTEFVKAVEDLDFSAREVIVSTVLEPLNEPSRRARIQAWIATIS